MSAKESAPSATLTTVAETPSTAEAMHDPCTITRSAPPANNRTRRQQDSAVVASAVQAWLRSCVAALTAAYERCDVREQSETITSASWRQFAQRAGQARCAAALQRYPVVAQGCAWCSEPVILVDAYYVEGKNTATRAKLQSIESCHSGYAATRATVLATLRLLLSAHRLRRDVVCTACSSASRTQVVTCC